MVRVLSDVVLRWLTATSAVLLFVLVVAAGFGRPAHAQVTLTVAGQPDGNGTCDDHGVCSTLRAAVIRADAERDGRDTIVVPAGTYVLTSTLELTRSMVIRGAGADRTFVDGGGGVRVFSVATSAIVDVSALTVRNGHVGEGGAGAGIDSDGDLTLSDVLVVGNTAGPLVDDSVPQGGVGRGGGIRSSGTLTMNRGSVSGNSASEGGGIIALPRGPRLGSVKISGTRIADNLGGGLETFGPATLDGVTLTGNRRASRHSGGGGLVVSSMTSAGSTFTGSAVVTSSTISENEARDGGGVLNQGGRVTLTGTTVNGNFAGGLSGLVSGDGGGIATTGGLLTLTNTTIANNGALTTTFRGGFMPPGIGAVAGGPVTLDFVTIAGNNVLNEASARVEPTSVGGIRATGAIHNSIVAGNGGLNCGGTLASAGYNLESAHDCGLTAKGDQRDVDPRLGELDDNGGPTATMGLPATSPAADAADPRCDVVADQRGVARPQGTRCDIGAYELLGGGTPRPTALPRPPVTGGGSEPEGDPLGMALLLAPLAAVWLGLASRRARHARSAAR